MSDTLFILIGGMLAAWAVLRLLGAERQQQIQELHKKWQEHQTELAKKAHARKH